MVYSTVASTVVLALLHGTEVMCTSCLGAADSNRLWSIFSQRSLTVIHLHHRGQVHTEVG
jgi:hypothetical protein